MKNPFTFEKGMEILEQGGNTAKQQIKTTTQSVTSQVTGQQPTSQQNPNSPSQTVGLQEQILGTPQPPNQLNGFKAQILGANGSPTPQTSGGSAQLLGSNNQAPVSQSSEGQAVPDQAKQENDKFLQDLYGGTHDPVQAQQVLSQENLAKKAQDDQAKQQMIKSQLEFVKTDIEDKMAMYRHQRVEEKKEEEKVEEQQKMEELQLEQKKKDDDIVLQRKQTSIENKAPGAG